MAVVFQVGELSDMSKVKVPENFPKCGDFTVDKI